MILKRCPNCGNIIRPQDNVCRNCGVEFERKRFIPKPPQSGTAIYVKVILGIAVVIIILLWLSSLLKTSEPCVACQGTGKTVCQFCDKGIARCDECRGLGRVPPFYNDCRKCKGTGTQGTCPKCNGTGKVKCTSCKGTGITPE